MQKNQIDIFKADNSTSLLLKYVESGISAGFPSPADDFIDQSLDLNREFIKNKSATFFGRVKGESMKNIGINNGDLLIIDKSIEPSNGKVAVCFIDGEFTVKSIKIENKVCWLIAENENYKPIKVTAENDFLIWGIVVHVIKTL